MHVVVFLVGWYRRAWRDFAQFAHSQVSAGAASRASAGKAAGASAGASAGVPPCCAFSLDSHLQSDAAQDLAADQVCDSALCVTKA